MSDLLGFISIALVFMLTFFAGSLRPNISKILFVALIIRVLVMLIGHYLVTLPDSTADAMSFEREAWSIAQGGFFNVIDNYIGPDPKFISWLIAIPYSLFGRSILMAQSMSLFFGIGCVFLGWEVAKIIWGKQTANKVGWVIALFPSLILYSVLVMRETYIVFFLIVTPSLIIAPAPIKHSSSIDTSPIIIAEGAIWTCLLIEPSSSTAVGEIYENLNFKTGKMAPIFLLSL